MTLKTAIMALAAFSAAATAVLVDVDAHANVANLVVLDAAVHVSLLGPAVVHPPPPKVHSLVARDDDVAVCTTTATSADATNCNALCGYLDANVNATLGIPANAHGALTVGTCVLGFANYDCTAEADVVYADLATACHALVTACVANGKNGVYNSSAYTVSFDVAATYVEVLPKLGC